MFELYVLRHSKSSWSNLNLEDFDRPLNKRGKKNAKLVCEFFVTKKINFDYVLGRDQLIYRPTTRAACASYFTAVIFEAKRASVFGIKRNSSLLS